MKFGKVSDSVCLKIVHQAVHYVVCTLDMIHYSTTRILAYIINYTM